VYLERFGFGIFIIEPHISHCTRSVSGSAGPVGWSSSVRPTSCDQPTDSVYASLPALSLDCFKVNFIRRFFFLCPPLTGFFAAIAIGHPIRFVYSMTSATFFKKAKGFLKRHFAADEPDDLQTRVQSQDVAVHSLHRYDRRRLFWPHMLEQNQQSLDALHGLRN